MALGVPSPVTVSKSPVSARLTPWWPLQLPRGELASYRSLPSLGVRCRSASQLVACRSTCQSPFPDFLCRPSFPSRRGLLAMTPRNPRPVPHQLHWEVVSQKHPDFCGLPSSLRTGASGKAAGRPGLQTQGQNRRWPEVPMRQRGTWQRASPFQEPTRRTFLLERSRPGPRAAGRASFQRLLMTCGEAAQQSFRRSDGRSRRQMFPTYVEN